MCNYNMADTLDIALRSILDQLDERFEIVLVDDGSSDNSVAVIQKLQQEYPNLRLFELQRDSQRQLGYTRNASVREAKGEYVLLHLDCDDITAPHLKDLMEVYHQIESCFPQDILLSSSPVQIGKREFLLKYGPYRNIHRGEDLDMHGRLATVNGFIPLKSHSFKTRLPKTRADRLYRTFYYTFDTLRNHFRANAKLSTYFYDEIVHQTRLNLRTRILRLSMAIPAWLRAKQQGPLEEAAKLDGRVEMQAYKAKMGGTFKKIMNDHGREPDWTKITPDGRAYFDL